MADHLRIGLRFRRSQARVLEAVAERAKRLDLGPDNPDAGYMVELLTKAANAARNGEPLVVVCNSPMEAHLIAAGFGQYGIVAPTVEELSPA